MEMERTWMMFSALPSNAQIQHLNIKLHRRCCSFFGLFSSLPSLTQPPDCEKVFFYVQVNHRILTLIDNSFFVRVVCVNHIYRHYELLQGMHP